VELEAAESKSLHFTGSEGNGISGRAFGDPDDRLVILMHGGGQTRRSWRRTAQALATRGYYAVTIDHRGHGDSDWVSSKQYELPHFAADLACVIRQLAPSQPPVLVGASLGGLTSMYGVGTGILPEVAAIVLADVVHRAEASGAAQLRGFMDARPEGYASVEEAADAIDRHMPDRGRRRNLDGLARNLRQGEDGRWRWHWDPAFLANRAPGGQRFGDGTDELNNAIKAISCPLLLVRGGRSEIVSPALAAEFRALLPAADYVEIPNVGHMVAGDTTRLSPAPCSIISIAMPARGQIPQAAPARANREGRGRHDPSL
jgi:non-heme chloroperoxidase